MSRDSEFDDDYVCCLEILYREIFNTAMRDCVPQFKKVLKKHLTKEQLEAIQNDMNEFYREQLRKYLEV